MKFILIFLLSYSNLAFAESTFVPLAVYEKVTYQLIPENKKNSSFPLNFALNLSSISNLDDATVIRMSKYDLRNNYIKNKKYPVNSISLLKTYKNKELTKLLIPMFKELNYESMKKIPLDGVFSHFYSEFIEVIARQQTQGKALIFKKRLDYWLNLYNKPANTALETWEREEISDCIMLLAETLHFYHMKTLSETEYKKITEMHLSSPYKFSWLIARYEGRWDKNIKKKPVQLIPLKSKVNNFSSYRKDENAFKFLLNSHNIKGFGFSNIVGKIIYFKNKAIVQFGLIGKSRRYGRGGSFLLTIEGKKIIVESLSSWVT